MSSNTNLSVLCTPHISESISLLSSEAPSPNYRGLLNLGVIILIVANSRLIIENMIKYGLLLTIPSPYVILFEYASWPCLSTYLFLLQPMLLLGYLL